MIMGIPIITALQSTANSHLTQDHNFYAMKVVENHVYVLLNNIQNSLIF